MEIKPISKSNHKDTMMLINIIVFQVVVQVLDLFMSNPGLVAALKRAKARNLVKQQKRCT